MATMGLALPGRLELQRGAPAGDASGSFRNPAKYSAGNARSPSRRFTTGGSLQAGELPAMSACIRSMAGA